jgi:hypothetical protein
MKYDLKELLSPKNIYHFIQGNARMLGDNFKMLPRYQKEQVIFRAQFCKDDCIPAGECKYCGCSVPGKLYVTESCNDGERFPDLMSEENWEKFKKENGFKMGKK